MSDFDPTNRELCPDGACVGVIGSDGTCKECGTVAVSATQHSRLRGMNLADSESEASDDDSDDRELCPDDMCVGLIGSNGRCNECGALARDLTPEPRAADDPESQDDDGDDGDADDDRQLCPDDMCIGIIGSNGRCKECGTAANSGGS